MEKKNLCVEIYETMQLGTKKKDTSAAMEWLEKHKLLHCWVHGEYLSPKNEIGYSETILGKDACLVAEGYYGVQASLKSSITGHHKWAKLSLQKRYMFLNEFTKKLQAKKELFTHFYDLLCQKNDFDMFLDYFYFYSSLSYHLAPDWEPNGIVLVILSDKSPTWFIASASAAALWAGCSIIIKPSTKFPFFPFILAEICLEAGLPNGLINIVPGPSNIINELGTHTFEKFIFGGACSEAIKIGCMVPVHNYLPFIFGHTTFILFDTCDVDGAIDKLFSENWEYSQQGTWSSDLIVVQESIYEIVIEKLTRKMKNVELSDHKFECKENKSLNLEKILREAEKFGVKVYVTKDASGSDQILITEYDLDICDPDAPVTTLLVFKTAKEAVNIVNKHSYYLGTSIWTENLSQAMEVASELESCTVWVNCHGVVNASVPMEASCKSGTGVIGGFDGGLACMRHRVESTMDLKTTHLARTQSQEIAEITRNANNAFKKWKCNNNRKEHLLKIISQIQKTNKLNNPDDTVDKILHFWAFNGNSYQITVGAEKDDLFAAQSKKPIGVIAMIMDDNQDIITTFVSWVTPAIAMGNVVIVVTSEELYSQLQPVIKCFAENLPSGVLNVLQKLDHTYQLAKDSHTQAIWTRNQDCSIQNEIGSSPIFKSIWTPPFSVLLNCTLFVKHCLKNKVIWFPTINSSG